MDKELKSRKFRIVTHPKVEEDLQALPEEINTHYEGVYCYILSIDPYNRCGLSGHYLEHGRLKGLYTIDLKDASEKTYRVVYKISELPNKQPEVFVISVDRHDDAYQKANERYIPPRPKSKSFY